MNRPNKADFISAYCYAYGATKAQAGEVYKTASPDYIQAIIDSMKQDAKRTFYND